MEKHTVIKKTKKQILAIPAPKIHGMFWVGASAKTQKKQTTEEMTVTRCGQTWNDSFFGGLTFSPLPFLVRRETVCTHGDCGLKKDNDGNIYPRNHFLPPSPVSRVEGTSSPERFVATVWQLIKSVMCATYFWCYGAKLKITHPSIYF